MKIIAHRGGAGHALENSETAFKNAIQQRSEAIELDVRTTKDRRLVVNHDATMSRTANDARKISRCTWEEIKTVKLKDKSPLLLLEDALQIIGSTPVIIEIKDSGSAELVLDVLKKFPQAQTRIGSFRYAELEMIKQQRPELPCYAFALFRPIHTIRIAKKLGIEAAGFPWWCINPLSYHFAKKLKGRSYVYTVNSTKLVHFIHKHYPAVDICTNYPGRFIVRQ